MQNTLLKGLVAYWPLHQASGDELDVMGLFNLVAAGVGGPGSADGKVIRSRDFELADNDRLGMAAAESRLDFGNEDMTLILWSQKESTPAGLLYMLNKISTVGTETGYELKWLNTSNRFAFKMGDGVVETELAFGSLGAPVDARFYFLAMGYDAALDQVWVRADMGTIDVAANANGLAGSGTPFIIGANQGQNLFWDGLICEVGLWRRRPTEAEQAWLFNDGRGRTYPFDGRPSPILVPQRYPRRGVYRVPGHIGPWLAT